MGARDALFDASFVHARARALGEPYVVNSPNCYSVRAGGKQIDKLVTLTAAGDPVNVNLFVITGMVKIFSVFGIFEDVTNVDDIEDVKLDVYDGTVSIDVTNTAGVICDLVTLNSALIKADDSTVALVLLNADQVRINEATKQAILDPIIVNAKNGVATYLRMCYKNVDTNLNCQVRWYTEWRSVCGSPGIVVAV